MAADSVDALMRDLARTPEIKAAPIVLGAGDRIGRFEILRTLGEGGFGRVYEARDGKLGRHVALKLLHVPTAAQLERFRAEAETVARLQHPGIVTLHDFGETDDGIPFLVLELLSGETLAARLAHGPLGVGDLVEVLVPIARALVHAHALGIVHRDIKPSNVMSCGDGQVKLLDFGLAGLVDAEIGAGGTPGFTAPEQLRGAKPDARSDVFAVGVLAHVALTGALPPSGTIASPALATLIARAVAPDPADRFATAQDLLDALLAARSPDGPIPDEPYHWLEAFTETDRAWFFGRERETAQLRQILVARGRAAVVGPSGAGKSSLVHAGLIPRMRDEGWTVIAMRPGREPLRALRDRIVDAEASLSSELHATTLLEAPGKVGEALRSHARTSGRRWLLVIDQLEELYTITDDRAVRIAFADALLGAADDPAGSIRLVITVREDFLSRLTDTPALRDAIVRDMLLLAAPDEAGLVEALRAPAERAGHTFADGVIEDIVAQLVHEAAPLPLLQLAGSRLWVRRDRRTRSIGRAALVEVGGVAGIVAAHAEDVIRHLDAHELEAARTMLSRLVTSEGTRQPMPRAELVTSEIAERALARLIDGRLLTTTGDSVELAHESLIRDWTRLRDWLGEQRDERRLAERLAAAAALWTERDRPVDLLWKGALLDQARTIAVGPSVQPFVAAAVARARTTQRRRRVFEVTAVAVVGIAVTFAWFAVRASRRAEAAARVQRIIETARTSVDPAKAALLLAELDPDDEPASGLAVALQIASEPVPVAVLRGHARHVSNAVFDPSGTHVLTASADGTFRVWNVDGTGQPIVLHASNGDLSGTFGADGRAVLGMVKDRAAYLWSTLSSEPRVWHGAITAAAFGPDGMIVLGWADGRVTLEANADSTLLGRLAGQVRNVQLAGNRVLASGNDPIVRLFGLDGQSSLDLPHVGVKMLAARVTGRRVVTASGDGHITVWAIDDVPRIVDQRLTDLGGGLPAVDARGTTIAWAVGSDIHVAAIGGAETAVLRGHLGDVSSLAFTADDRIVSAAADQTARVWRPGSDEPPLVLRGHVATVNEVAASPDGTHAVTAGDDGTARVWSLDDPIGWRALRGHTGLVDTARFSDDGARIATASHDGTVRVWDAATGKAERVLGSGGETCHGADWSRDGRIATACGEALHVWAAGPDPRVIPVPGDGLRSVAFGRDGTHVVISAETAITVVDLIAGTSWSSPHGGEHVAFSPDGRSVLVAGMDGFVRRFAIEGGEPQVFRGNSAYLLRAWFSPDSQSIVTAGGDGLVQLWDRSGAEIVSARRRTGSGNVSFAKDGRRIAYGLADGTAAIVRLDRADPPVILHGHTAGVLEVMFDPSGQRVVTASADHGVRVWWVAWRVLIARLQAATTDCLAIEDRRDVLGESESTAESNRIACETRNGR